jgi:hypothetical protein
VFTADTDRALLIQLTEQLYAIVREDNHAPFPPLTAPLTAAVYLVVGRLRALTDPDVRAAAVEAVVFETKFGEIITAVQTQQMQLMTGCDTTSTPTNNLESTLLVLGLKRLLTASVFPSGKAMVKRKRDMLSQLVGCPDTTAPGLTSSLAQWELTRSHLIPGSISLLQSLGRSRKQHEQQQQQQQPQQLLATEAPESTLDRLQHSAGHGVQSLGGAHFHEDSRRSSFRMLRTMHGVGPCSGAVCSSKQCMPENHPSLPQMATQNLHIHSSSPFLLWLPQERAQRT